MTSAEKRNAYRNNAKAIGIGNEFWNASEAAGLAGIVADLEGPELVTEAGHRFKNLCCCSYLDLDRHPDVVNGAIEALRRYGTLDHCIPRARVQIPALLELEAVLGELFQADAVSAISASVASLGVLPLIASGHLTGGERPIMLFDKWAHVSMASAKPACADETEVITIKHHDLNAIEDYCRTGKPVCYVCDGSDSLGGYAPVEALRDLQDRYGLYVYYDDCHSISVYGDRGQGYVRSHLDHVDSRTIIVATLNKAFGASGAVVLFGERSHQDLKVVERFAGPLSYSQPMNTAAVGAGLASAKLHLTPELKRLQDKLQTNIALLDSLCPTRHAGETYPIRVLDFAEDEVIEAGRRVFEAGFYASPVFFPIVPRGNAGLRVMMRAELTSDDLHRFAEAVTGKTPEPQGALV